MSARGHIKYIERHTLTEVLNNEVCGMREDEKDTHLTGRQIEVLKLKRKGLSQADIARKLKTTRGNISTIETTAQKNIAKAEKTLKLYRALNAPVWITVPSGTDLYEIPQLIFKEADRRKIKISIDSATVIVRLKASAPDRIEHRVTSGDINISVDENGNVTIY
jgi:HTH-type transcriptional regulator, fmd operon transcriptional regulator